MSKKAKIQVKVGVLRHGQSFACQPAFYITLQEANYWFSIGALERGEPAGKSAKHRGAPLMRLSKPTTDRLQLRSPLGASLTIQCLFDSLGGLDETESESLALAASFAPGRIPVTVLPGWTTPDVVFAP